MDNEIGLETEFREAFMNVTAYLDENGIPMESIYDNKKPEFLPENISKDWDIIQEYYKQEEEEDKERGIPVFT